MFLEEAFSLLKSGMLQETRGEAANGIRFHDRCCHWPDLAPAPYHGPQRRF